MASPAQIAATQLDRRKSTAPSTPQGRVKSSMNALKHGDRSRKLALLREESCAIEERLRKWMAIGDAQNDVEEYLIRKYKATTTDGRGKASGVGPYAIELDRSEDRGRETHESGDARFGADDLFASGDRQDDCLERPGVIDPDGVEQHGDKMSWTGEIGENASNEANFVENMSIAEPQESIQVTADSGALSGLDNGLAQPSEGSTPEQGKAPASGSYGGNPKPKTSDSTDRACRGSLPATVSEGEQTRLQLEKERLAVERNGSRPGDHRLRRNDDSDNSPIDRSVASGYL